MVSKVNFVNEQRQPLTENVISHGPQIPNAGVSTPSGRPMRGAIVNDVRKKHSERYLEIRKLTPRAPPRNPPHPRSPRDADRQGVQRASEKFKELLRLRADKSGTESSQVLKQMRERFPSLFVNKNFSMLGQFGHVPGVDVGDCFSCRAELNLVGLHRPLQAGIDWKDVDFTRKDGNKESLAVSLVVSGGYEDDLDHGETLIYTGQGGKDRGVKQQTKDQKEEGGNLALVNSQIRAHPIRVIRGRQDASRSSKRVFSYDGLYKVVDHVVDKGKSGFKVFRFRLVRERLQAPLIWSRGKFPETRYFTARRNRL